jgi:hypothetical protein
MISVVSLIAPAVVAFSALPAGAANTAPVNTSLPSVSDTTPHDGDLLTGYRGGWTGLSPITFTFQWMRCDASGATCTAIAGATTSTYAVTAADVGTTLRVHVGASNSLGSTTADSAATAVVGARAPANQALPAISGVASAGTTLSGTPGTWLGTAPISFAYRWKRCDVTGTTCSSITGATAPSYTVGLADAGSTLRLAVTASNAGGTSSATSAPTGIVGAVVPANVAPPTLSDTTPHDRDTIVGYTGSWTGTAPIAYSFAWQRCDASGGSCSPIVGAVGSSYDVQSVDVGSTIEVLVTASNAGGTSSVASAPSALVAAAPPENTAWPVISGNASFGDVLSATTGSWVGTPPITFTFRWRRCDPSGTTCSSITGATASTYTVDQADAGSTVRVTVKATNAGGSRSMSSLPTGVIGAVAPANVAPPTVNDVTPHDLDTLTVYPGSWTGTDPISESFQWLRCDGTGAACAPVAGAVSPSYAVGASDLGSTLAVDVTATNDAGSSTVRTAVTAIVAAAAPVASGLPVVSGTARDFSTLSASTVSWTGTVPITLSTKWMRCNTSGGGCITITGATTTAYTLTSADVGSTVRFAVNAVNAGGTASATSVATPVVAPLAPAILAAPGATGTAEDGLALTTTAGTWTGTTPMTFAYQWLRCGPGGASCEAIPGATAPSYTLADADVGATVAAAVTATNSGGATTATGAVSSVVSPLGASLFADSFDGPDGVITNQYAFDNPTHPDAVISPDWQATSGSFLRRSSTGWTGVPDDVAPDATSSNGTNSSVFRLRSVRSDFGDVAVSFSLLNNGLTSTPSTPATDFDGVHVWLRYVDETRLYALSVNRRDGTIRIKKKCPGGPSNGGVYLDLLPSQHLTVPYGVWQQVQATAQDNPDGSVTLGLYRDYALVARVTDTGAGCAPITVAGRVGIRGDNDDFQVDGLVVRGL